MWCDGSLTVWCDGGSYECGGECSHEPYGANRCDGDGLNGCGRDDSTGNGDGSGRGDGDLIVLCWHDDRDCRAAHQRDGDRAQRYAQSCTKKHYAQCCHAVR